MTLMFSVGGVDLDRIYEYIQQHPNDFMPWVQKDQFDFKKTGILSVAGYYSALHKAQANGRIPKYVHYLFFNSLPRKGEVLFNTTNVIEANGTKVEDLTRAEIESRLQVKEIMQTLKQDCPGFEKCFLLQTATQIGIRETRRIKGLYTFTGEDVRQGAKFPDKEDFTSSKKSKIFIGF